MSVTTTTLTATIGPSTLLIPVTSTVGLSPNNPVQIDSEIFFIAGSITSTSFRARWRGAEGTAAAAHDVNAQVMVGATGADFPATAAGNIGPIPPTEDLVITIGQDQTVTLPNQNAQYNINKPSICNITLAAASPLNVGLQAVFVSNTAFAHVITYAAGFLGGTNTVLTLTAKVGASVILQVGIGGQIAVAGAAGQATLSS